MILATEYLPHVGTRPFLEGVAKCHIVITYQELVFAYWDGSGDSYNEDIMLTQPIPPPRQRSPQ
jgi:hypothetical protein